MIFMFARMMTYNVVHHYKTGYTMNKKTHELNFHI